MPINYKTKNIKDMIDGGGDIILIEKAADYRLYKSEDIIIETDQNGFITNIGTDLIDELFPDKI